MCEERIRALDPPLDWDDEERVVEALEEHIVEIEPPGPRRALVREADALLVQSELDVALESLNEYRAMCAKLAEALKMAQNTMQYRRYFDKNATYDTMKRWDVEEALVTAILKEWEDQNE
jgi:hypothetical protein